MLHAAAFISHLQWTAATFLLVKYNITHPLLTYHTITILNCRLFNEARLRKNPGVQSPRKWNVTKAHRRRTRTYTVAQTHDGCSRKGNSRWTDRTLICGNVLKTAGRSWAAVVKGAVGRTPAWRRCGCPCRRPRPLLRLPRLAQPALRLGAVALSSNNYKSHTTSTDTSSFFFFWCSVFRVALFPWNINFRLIPPKNPRDFHQAQPMVCVIIVWCSIFLLHINQSLFHWLIVLETV